MQRTTHRLKALPAIIKPNSNSDNSTLLGDTKCDDDTKSCGAMGSSAATGSAALLSAGFEAGFDFVVDGFS